MSILTDLNIPTDVNVNDSQELHDFLITMKQVIEDVINKAKQMQMEVRTSVPGTDDLTEGEDIRYNTGGVRRTYTMIDGEIRVHTET